MIGNNYAANYQRGSLNTLGQSGTTILEHYLKKTGTIVTGNGADISNNETNLGRSKRKAISQRVVLSLIDIAIKKGQPERAREYWNTYYCLNEVIGDGNRMHGKYCKNRICTVCSGNRKAELINKYLPIVNQWNEPYFVTLTITSAPLKRLNSLMKAMNRGLNLIIGKYKKRDQRKKGNKLIGIKSLECNFNPMKRTYNPHFHLIVPDKQTADILIKEWLYYCNRKGKFPASRKAQHSIKIYNNENCLVEVIKYGSKIFTRPEHSFDNKIKIYPKIYIAALHNILSAMKGIRLFDRFGFNLNKRAAIRSSKMLYDFDHFVYDAKLTDWIDTESELKLSNYSLPPDLIDILNNINTDLE